MEYTKSQSWGMCNLLLLWLTSWRIILGSRRWVFILEWCLLTFKLKFVGWTALDIYAVAVVLILSMERGPACTYREFNLIFYGVDNSTTLTQKLRKWIQLEGIRHKTRSYGRRVRSYMGLNFKYDYYQFIAWLQIKSALNLASFQY
jgi:hypothetical protein